MFVRDPCGIVCIIFTYVAVFYADYVVVKWVVLLTMVDSLWGTFNAVLFNIVLSFLVLSHIKAVITDPGTVPIPQTRLDFSDIYSPDESCELMNWSVCARCETYRPPRAHHCRICRRCVRKMDHHCPWINNCVGERNQKYFLQFLIYVGALSVYAITLVVLSWIKECPDCIQDVPLKQARMMHCIILLLESALFGMFVVAILIDQMQAILQDETAVEQVMRHGPFRPDKPKMTLLTEVELFIQKISCPGVWLCSNGQISLQIFMLGSSIQTEMYKPCFPVRFNEKFLFKKSFFKERRLTELHRGLNNEWFYIELIQWKSCDEGYVLAFFHTTLDDLLYPSSFRVNSSGTYLDLLLEPTKLFPGTLSPKLEICTKTTIEEVFNSNNGVDNSLVLSTALPHTKKCTTRSVCHTSSFSRAQKFRDANRKSKKPVFKCTKANEGFPSLEDTNRVLKVSRSKQQQHLTKHREHATDSLTEQSCYCMSEPTDLRNRVSVEKVNTSSSNVRSSEKSYCPVCVKYECYFNCPKENKNGSSNLKLCSVCQINAKKFHINYEDSPCRSEVSDSKKKVCFCLPKSRTENFMRQLNEKIQNGVQNGVASIRNCVNIDEICCEE